MVCAKKAQRPGKGTALGSMSGKMKDVFQDEGYGHSKVSKNKKVIFIPAVIPMSWKEAICLVVLVSTFAEKIKSQSLIHFIKTLEADF